MTYEPTRTQPAEYCSEIMISSNSFSSSSTTCSVSSGTDGKDAQIEFDESKLLHTHSGLDSDFPLAISEKDERYWERRRKNNAAAKRSRERRRLHDMAMEKQIHNLKLANAFLRNEIAVLQKRLSLQTASVDNPDDRSPTMSHKMGYFQIEDLSNLLSRNVTNFVCPNSSVDPVVGSNSLPIGSTKCLENIYQPDLFNGLQNPLDLSFKLKTDSIPEMRLNNSMPRTHSRSNSDTSNLDQRYWDRRRRNNEAVRKCRQNKKAKMQSLTTNSNHCNVDNTNNIVDKIHIKTKIESITNELEILKSQLKNSETIPKSDVTVECNIKTEETSNTNLSQRSLFSDDCRKTMKWKNKLIEADRSSRERNIEPERV